MLNLFKTNKFIINFLLLFYILLLRGATFFLPAKEWSAKNPGVLSELLYDYVGQSGIWAEVVAVLLLFLQALIVNVLVSKYRIMERVNLIPGLIYVLLASAIPEFLHLSPILIGTTFFLVALYILFGTHKKGDVSPAVFNIGFWMGIASLFFFPLIYFLLPLLLGINTIRKFSLKEWTGILVGFFVPNFLLFTYAYLKDQASALWTDHYLGNFAFNDLQVPFEWESFVKMGFFILLILICFASSGNYLYKKSAQVKKYISVLYVMLLLCILPFFIFYATGLNYLFLLVAPLSIFIAINFSNMEKGVAEIVHLLLIAGIILLQAKDLFL